ncbi:APC family permease [Streptoalloteichus hindustanus]|uniref:Amino acid transporter n=1 Tax=Streptoalloteichus hindustanus TaxID=2017 RepID=A0A1M4UKN5_STRHI|nr:amino acid permease [Streptoalloteichus hindustanus]SHE57341.1 Amino acid transporter [Streptoalloteichus hindustanus]
MATETADKPPSAVAGTGAVAGGDHRFRLGVLTGVAALGLDALASVSYGPEQVVLGLAAAGGAGVAWTLPVTAAIVLLLALLVLAYRQVIVAYPDGGGAYTVARRNLGQRAGLVAAASLIIDYVLNAAVSVAAGVAALTSAVPGLLPWTTELCLGALAVITLVNLRGVVASARAFALPAVVFVVALAAVVVLGLVRGEPVSPLPAPSQAQTTAGVGLLLVVAAFANGCSALTGVEAIANATPAFRSPAPRRAARAEALLGLLLGGLLLGLAVLVERFDVRPVEGRTLLSLLVEGSFGTGFGYVVVQLATVLLLALAANTSFGGLPVLAARLSRDHFLPHAFGLKADRLVHRAGVLVLAALSAVLLVATGGRLDLLVPMFAIGVFVGFALCQAGMVRHWLRTRGRGWRWRLALNATGAVVTAACAAVVTAVKFTDGAWLVAVVLPLLVVLLTRVNLAYQAIGRALGLGQPLERPRRDESVVVVPVAGLSVLTSRCLSTALSLGERVVAVHVVTGDGGPGAAELQRGWEAWHPDVPLTLVERGPGGLGPTIARWVRGRQERHVVVLVGEVRPRRWWHRALHNGQGAAIARSVGRLGVAVCRLQHPLGLPPAPVRPPAARPALRD